MARDLKKPISAYAKAYGRRFDKWAGVIDAERRTIPRRTRRGISPRYER